MISQNLVEKSPEQDSWRPLFGKRSYLLKGRFFHLFSWLARLRPRLTCARQMPVVFPVSFPPALQCCQGALASPSQQRDCFEPSRVSQALEATPTLAVADNPPPTRGERGRGQKERPALPSSKPAHGAAVGSLPASGPLAWDSSPSPRAVPSSQLQLQAPRDGGTRVSPSCANSQDGRSQDTTAGSLPSADIDSPQRSGISLESAWRQGGPFLEALGETF